MLANHEIGFVKLYCLMCEIMQGGDCVTWDRDRRWINPPRWMLKHPWIITIYVCLIFMFSTCMLYRVTSLTYYQLLLLKRNIVNLYYINLPQICTPSSGTVCLILVRWNNT